jgi:hypothetical protein
MWGILVVAFLAFVFLLFVLRAMERGGDPETDKREEGDER